MLYLHLAPEQFTCDKEKIFWTLTFFKDGRAAKWSENLFHQEADTVRATGHKTPGESSVNITVSSYDTTHLQENPQRLE